MKALLILSDKIDALNTAIARCASWLVLACTLICGITATLRYIFSWGSNALLELQWCCFGLIFLFCAAWTLKIGGHVRIDVIFSRFSSKTKAWVDIFGTVLFLWPVCILITVDAWSYGLIAWQTGESSPNPGGLPWWPIKFAIPIAFALLSLQGLSEVIKNIARLKSET